MAALTVVRAKEDEALARQLLNDKYQLDESVELELDVKKRGYPKDAATDIAIATVDRYLRDTGSALEVTFCCFSASDLDAYRARLG